MDLSRFIDAQATAFDRARSELVAGAKVSHWMWYIFPQLTALGRSEVAQFYGIASLAEARSYIAHPVLGARLSELTRIVLGHRGRSALAIFGSPDDLKFRSAMTLFAVAAPEQLEFRWAIAAFYDGPDRRTLDLLGVGRIVANFGDAYSCHLPSRGGAMGRA
jgi:uncharacterized protein (DUF1810 family)